ncbi:hypothetical protein [Emergencia sp. 1XD21-10]|uniref:hypothetical protein n=1 Tax=Emergencia sp. 1XD21-10 TaxID=2304569 RepID=UPI00137A4635|nr:hypothetical protein [Emergencia sp. 1XD21-10]NCE98390.1 hypothetical protein [Emergencia sp. 1XD21-10]
MRILKRKGISLTDEEVVLLVKGELKNGNLDISIINDNVVIEPVGLCYVEGLPDSDYDVIDLNK